MYRFVAVLLLWAGCSSSRAQSQPEAGAEIRRVREASNQAIARQDIAAFGASLADDFLIVRGNSTAETSRQSYLEAMAKNLGKGLRYRRITDKVELSAAAPLAAENGHWLATFPDGRKAYGGTYLAMWRRVGSAWKIRSELFVLLNCFDQQACANYLKNN